MAIIRGKQFLPREIYDRVHEAGGPRPWRECRDCGGWISTESGQHVEGIVKLTLAEFLERFGPRCPNEKAPPTQAPGEKGSGT